MMLAAKTRKQSGWKHSDRVSYSKCFDISCSEPNCKCLAHVCSPFDCSKPVGGSSHIWPHKSQERSRKISKNSHLFLDEGDESVSSRFKSLRVPDDLAVSVEEETRKH